MKYLPDHRLVRARRGVSRRALAPLAALLACTALATPALAADGDAPENKDKKDEIVVQGSLGALPLKDVGSVFGFNKTLVETPRSASRYQGADGPFRDLSDLRPRFAGAGHLHQLVLRHRRRAGHSRRAFRCLLSRHVAAG
jgi:hypothetical protein